MSAGADFELAPHHDTGAYAAAFAAQGRLHIPNLLRDEDARRLHGALSRRAAWEIRFIHKGARIMTPAQWDAVPTAPRAQMETELAEAARTPGRFSARYLTANLSMAGEPFAGDDADMAALVRFLNGESFLSFARAVTCDTTIKLADAQASLYRPGDYLHRHNDFIEEQHGDRVAAYILNLTPLWQAEWGGLLNFVRDDGHVAEAYTPTWNALNLLKVPQLHFVGAVAPFVTEPRLSVSGWVRRR